jgi:hypothetical protein
MSDALFPYFRDGSGTPLTPRCPATVWETATETVPGLTFNGNPVAWLSQKTNQIYCCDDSIPYIPNQPPFRCADKNMEPLPGSSTTKTITVTSGLSIVGQSATLLITPKLLAHAKAHFGCDSWPGVALEDDGGEGSAGSHWEKRMLMNEYMGAAPTGFVNSKSAFTLATLEDSGWYQADYSAADPLMWGYNGGCDQFGACRTSTCTVSDPNPKACTFDRSGYGQCRTNEEHMDGCPFIDPSVCVRLHVHTSVRIVHVNGVALTHCFFR